GCRSTTEDGALRNRQATQKLTDGIGREVSVPVRPERIISLAPNLTEILFAIGLGDRIVGVTSYCDFPAAALTKARVGDTITPNPERVIALKPDLVLVTTSSQLESLTRQLDRLSIPVYVTNPRTVRDIVVTIRLLGEVTGEQKRAGELANEMERRLRQIEGRVSRLPRLRVLYMLQLDPLIVPGRRTFLNDMITIAGGELISGMEEADYPQFSRESVLVRAPEVILLPSGHGTGGIDIDAVRNLFRRTPAVSANRVLTIDADLVDRPGPRIIDGLEQIAQALHPESP
ncbi:MAG: cobalamin-binding protein, partial [Acidobacteria bacterium]|nr:cobalamin-binding protein [Acidobacteriota bacterium]